MRIPFLGSSEAEQILAEGRSESIRQLHPDAKILEQLARCALLHMEQSAIKKAYLCQSSDRLELAREIKIEATKLAAYFVEISDSPEVIKIRKMLGRVLTKANKALGKEKFRSTKRVWKALKGLTHTHSLAKKVFDDINKRLGVDEEIDWTAVGLDRVHYVGLHHLFG